MYLSLEITDDNNDLMPGFQFYLQKVSAQFHSTVKAFKAARVCISVRTGASPESDETAALLKNSEVFPLASVDATTATLAQELPLCRLVVDGITHTFLR